MGAGLGDGLPLGVAVGEALALGWGVGVGLGIALGVEPPPGGNGAAGMPPFVLHADKAAQNAVAVKVATSGLNMAQEGYTWLIRAYPAAASKHGSHAAYAIGGS